MTYEMPAEFSGQHRDLDQCLLHPVLAEEFLSGLNDPAHNLGRMSLGDSHQFHFRGIAA